MILDEAIERYTNNAEYERTHGNLQGCLDFRQLAEWLKELKRDREVLTELDAAIDCYEKCETCQGFREYSPSQFIKDVIRINKEVNADADSN